jgi:hypothetical protein
MPRSAATFFLALVVSCGDLCSNDPQRVVVSPDGKYEAVVFSRDCGAATNFSTQVSILEAGAALPDRAGNALVYIGQHPLEVEWVGSSGILVRGAPEKPTWLATEVNGVSVAHTP